MPISGLPHGTASKTKIHLRGGFLFDDYGFLRIDFYDGVGKEINVGFGRIGLFGRYFFYPNTKEKVLAKNFIN